MNRKLREEYDNLRFFVKERYNLEMKEDPEEMKRDEYGMIFSFLYFLMSLKVWEENLAQKPTINKRSLTHFQENVSNINHAFLLTILHLKIPAIIMLRRTQENLLTFLYYNEHEIESAKKERDSNFRPFRDFSGLKEYIKSYPFREKYTMNDQQLRMLLSEIIDQWAHQYRELSNYVHGSNAKYFSKSNLVDALSISAADFEQIKKNVLILSSVFNALMIIFFFDDYVNFDEQQEKYFVRCAIANDFGYKSRIMHLFYEI